MSVPQPIFGVSPFPNVFINTPALVASLTVSQGGNGANTQVNTIDLSTGSFISPVSAELFYASSYISPISNTNTDSNTVTLTGDDFQGTNAGTDTYTVIGDFNAIVGDAASTSVLNVAANSGILDLVSGNGTTTLVGSGASTLNIRSAGPVGSTLTVFGETASVNYVGGTGTDEIIGGTGSMSIQGGTGGSLLVFGSTTTMNFVGGGESDTIVGGLGAETIAAGTGAVFAGTGGSILSALGAQTYLAGNQSGDQVTASKAGGDILVAGTGNETLSGAASGYANLIFGGTAGTDTVTMGHGNDTYVGGTSGTMLQVGSGNTNVFLGAGAANTLEFVSGNTGGSNFITNYRVGTDHIVDTGYSSAPTVSSAAGGTMLTFSDKTSVTLVGVTSTNLGAILG